MSAIVYADDSQSITESLWQLLPTINFDLLSTPQRAPAEPLSLVDAIVENSPSLAPIINQLNISDESLEAPSLDTLAKKMSALSNQLDGYQQELQTLSQTTQGVISNEAEDQLNNLNDLLLTIQLNANLPTK
ncbi:MAG: hypothetical protein CMF46_03585 [Legionellales bacterium]|nr:hypothetical protein [Legionellales bacterium]|tara:strand:+ start:858 stop:1253 length:396 start_codon:yes stop_codon:yes gene_type:complete